MSPARLNPSHTSEHSLSGEKLSLLAIFAHPEDESFGPAGTLAKYAGEGVQVTFVTATRDATRPTTTSDVHLEIADEPLRERSCACRTSGIRRVCLYNNQSGELEKEDPVVLEDKLVRLIREIHAQVIVTYSPSGLGGDSDHRVISRITTMAFHDAGDPSKFSHHFREGLGAYAPQKLYYCVLPQSLITNWETKDLSALPDEQITTVLDVSASSEAMNKALYCHCNQSLDFIQWLDRGRKEWQAEYYLLAESSLNKKPRREKDLFAGLR